MLAIVVRVAVVGILAIGSLIYLNNRETTQFQNTPRDNPRRSSQAGSSGSSQRRKQNASNSTCPICMYEIEDSFNRLPCDHRLHLQCYRQLVINSETPRRCPLCRESF